MIPTLLGKRLLFVTGKGGVGKSVVTAALGLVAARAGRRVLLCELAGPSTLGSFFGGATVGDVPVEVADNLWVTHVDAATWLADLITRLVPTRKLVRAILKNRVIDTFFRAAPGINEAATLHRLHSLSSADRGSPGAWQLVLVDMPATGHAVTYLRVPQILARLIRVGAAARVLGAIDAWIRDGKVSGVLLVTLPEELPVNETIELWGRLEGAMGLTPDGVLVNCVRAAPVSDDQLLDVLADHMPSGKDRREPDAMGSLVRGGEIGMGWSRRDRHYVERLRESLPGPFVEIPYQFESRDERELVEAMAAWLDPRSVRR